MRHDLYARLQELPMAFHGQWQSGQLLSRVTNDLSSIRRFFGFGLLFLVMNVLQLVVVTLVLLHMYWPLGLVVAAAVDPDRHAVATGSSGRTSLISRRVQDQQGDLATLAEEGAVGIRVIKSFGRGPFVSERYDDAARTLYDTSMDKVRLSVAVLDLPRGDPEPRRRRRAAARRARRGPRASSPSARWSRSSR